MNLFSRLPTVKEYGRSVNRFHATMINEVAAKSDCCFPMLNETSSRQLTINFAPHRNRRTQFFMITNGYATCLHLLFYN